MTDRGVRRTTYVRWTLFAVWMLVILSGVWLFFTYRPTAAMAYADMERIASWRVRSGAWARETHRWSGTAAIIVHFAVALGHVARRAVRQSSRHAAIVVLGLLAVLSGLALPWDQLALWRATVGDSIWGYTPVLGDNVRFVLINGIEVSTAMLRVLLTAHVVVLPMMTVAVGIGPAVVSRLRARRLASEVAG